MAVAAEVEVAEVAERQPREKVGRIDRMVPAPASGKCWQEGAVRRGSECLA